MILCDRCKKEIPKPDDGFRVAIGEREYDACWSCHEILKRELQILIKRSNALEEAWKASWLAGADEPKK